MFSSPVRGGGAGTRGGADAGGRRWCPGRLAPAGLGAAGLPGVRAGPGLGLRGEAPALFTAWGRVGGVRSLRSRCWAALHVNSGLLHASEGFQTKQALLLHCPG